MGFNRVYKALQEIFPEIDSRALKAAAIENSKDADAAVEAVLTKVIPRLNARSRSSSSPSSGGTSVQSLKGSEMGADGTCGQQNAFVENITSSDEEQHGQFFDAECHDQLPHDANSGNHQTCGESRTDNLSIMKLDQSEVSASNSNVALSSPINDCETHHDHENLQESEFEEKPMFDDSNEKYVELGTAEDHEIILSSLEKRNSGSLHSDLVEDNQSGICSDGQESEVEKLERKIGQSNHESFACPSSEGCSVDLVDRTQIPNAELVKELDVQVTASTEIDSTDKLVETEKGSTLNLGLSRSAHICCTDVLEDSIALERNNKKTLFTALQSVISLMREVEVEESMAAVAKEEAAKGGLDILQRVEDLREMLQHAKEANDMHAGEVHGEKAILATEVKELQSRLISLSDERDRSLGILNEMRQSLEARSAAAKKEIEAAEREKRDKEESARKALADQELLMEGVVKEAKFLKQQAEENAKLQEFLVERGHVVDVLQGEISVICQDVMLLKKQFDEHLPLSKSLTSSQTSCVLASSSSTVRSLTTELVDEVTDPADSSEEAGMMNLSVHTVDDAEAANDDQKMLSDEGWEIFDL